MSQLWEQASKRRQIRLTLEYSDPKGLRSRLKYVTDDRSRKERGKWATCGRW